MINVDYIESFEKIAYIMVKCVYFELEPNNPDVMKTARSDIDRAGFVDYFDCV